MGWPQYTYVAITLIGLGITLAKHGEPQGDHSIWITLFAAALIYWLLFEGGFFGVVS